MIQDLVKLLDFKNSKEKTLYEQERFFWQEAYAGSSVVLWQMFRVGFEVHKVIISAWNQKEGCWSNMNK